MYNLMMVKSDHYLHLRKALLSNTEFVFIHTPGKAQVEAPVAGVEPSRAPSPDVYGNMRHFYPVEKFDEVSLRLAFEQGWEEQEYIPYSQIQKAAAEKKIPDVAESMKKVTKSMNDFSKLLADMPPKISAVKNEHQHTHGAVEGNYFYHNPETIEYSKSDYSVTAKLYDQQIKPTTAMKYFYEVTKGSHNDTVAAQLAAAKYDPWLEKKYSIHVQVYDDGFDGKYKVVVIGNSGLDIYKSQYLVSSYHSFYEVQQKVLLMKKEVIEYLQEKEQGVIF